ncbi:hypothetical protein ACHAXT_005762 [Thalassiosira profunda]
MPTLKYDGTPQKEKGAKRSAGDPATPSDRFSQPPADVSDAHMKGNGCKEDAFSIAAAISAHKERQRGDDGIATGSRASDVVAVVLSAPTRQEPPPVAAAASKTPKRSNSTRMHLLMGDPSLPPGQCARVFASVSSSSPASLASLLGVDGMGGKPNDNVDDGDASSAGNLGPLQPGDVVRWNRLDVRNHYSISPDQKRQKLAHEEDASSGQQSLLSVICDFAPSWTDLAAGPSLARLCRITPKPAGEYELRWESGIHQSMETPKEVVTELAGWYCANAGPRMVTAILPTNQTCKRRKLREITAPNTLSHVVVRVLRCEKAIIPFSFPRKEGSLVTHTTLSDGAGSDDLLGMKSSANHGSALATLPKSVSAILLQSMKEGSRILLTHLLSQTTNQAVQGRESLVLTPTKDTTAAILTPDHPYWVKAKSPGEDEHEFASQPLTVERASQLFSMTQQHSPSPSKDEQQPGQCRGVMAVVAPLKDIIVDGVDTSFVEGSHWQTPHRLSRFLIDNQIISIGMGPVEMRSTYRSATLVLDPKSVSSEIVVNADADALKLLCLDVPTQDMVLGDPKDTFNPYLSHVGELLRGLCSESIPIRWVLEQESERNWFVTDATLLEI